MFNLPATTEFNQRIPKQKFYEKCEISAAVKRLIVEEIKEVRWTHKLSPETVNVSAGERVKEIEILTIALTEEKLSEIVLRQIDKKIPYYTLFILSHENKYQARIAFKEAAATKDELKVNRYFETPWMAKEDLPLQLEGFSLDEVYDNFVRQIAGDALSSGDNLKDDIAQSEARKKLEQEIARLEKQARTEKQPKKKFELVQRIKILKEKLKGV